MKNFNLLLLALLITFGTAFAKNPESFTLTIAIKQAPNADGTLRISIFESKENWLKKGQTIIESISDKGLVTIEVPGLAAGNYAVSVIHDENNNETLDTNTFGIPSEAYGFSNDARGMFGPASFEDSQFQLTTDTSISIDLD